MTDEQLQSMVRDAIGRIDPEPRRDLWPAMRARLDARTMRVSPLDWALIAAAIGWVLLFPAAALALLYQL